MPGLALLKLRQPLHAAENFTKPRNKAVSLKEALGRLKSTQRFLFYMYFRLLFFCLFLLSPLQFVGAQTSTASTTTPGVFEAVLNGVTDITSGVKNRITGQTPLQDTVLQKRAQERIINLAANISNRFEGLIARLDNIAGRLQKRIDKLESEGYDMSSARASLDSARSSLSAAKNDLSGIDAKVTGAIGSVDPRGKWREVRATYLRARDHVRAAHSSLRDTIRNLKTAPQSSTPPEVVATSTEATPN